MIQSAITKRVYLSLLASGMMALSACATSAESSKAEPAQVATTQAGTAGETTQLAEVSDPNEEVCRRVKQTTTRFTKKVCMTRKEWADMASNAQQNTATLQQRSFDAGRGS